MKIHKRLLIDSQPVALVNLSVRLELYSPGRALFTYRGQKPKHGELVEFDSAFADGDMRRVFLGFIESSTELANGTFQIIAREFSAMLNQRIAVNLRHCTPAQVLQIISERTGQEFVLPKTNWVNQVIARVQHIGSGYHLLDSLLKLWNVSKGIWQQQSDGRIFVGEHELSATGGKTLELPANLFSNNAVTGATLPLMPRFRPGVKIKLAGYSYVVTEVDIIDDTMRLRWHKNPWSNQLKAVS